MIRHCGLVVQTPEVFYLSAGSLAARSERFHLTYCTYYYCVTPVSTRHDEVILVKVALEVCFLKLVVYVNHRYLSQKFSHHDVA